MESAKGRIESFRTKWAQYDVVMDFLEKNYVQESKMERWMICYRRDVSYANIDTNNYTESWHNTLKKHFFKDSGMQRPDRVIHSLAKVALPHYQRKCMLQTLGVGRMTPAQKKARDSQHRAIDQLRKGGVSGMVLGTPLANTLAVRSFSDENHFYNIELDFSKRELGHFTSCSCPDFFQSRMVCKHISLAMMIVPFVEFESRGTWDRPSIPLEPIADIASDPVLEPIPPTDMYEIYIEKLGSLAQKKDPSVIVPEPQKSALENHLKEAYNILKTIVVNPNEKRQRQANYSASEQSSKRPCNNTL
jgi:hypothetical protein